MTPKLTFSMDNRIGSTFFLILTILLSSLNLFSYANYSSGGQWQLLQRNIGLVAMHTQVLRNNKVIMFDSTDFGSSYISLPNEKCRDNDKVVKPFDCTAHSILYDIASNTLKPLMILTDSRCSSGFLDMNGTLVQTGGYGDGYRRVREFTPCDDDPCDWFEYPPILSDQRTYATDQKLPDGRAIIIGGQNIYTYEFFPKKNEAAKDNVYLPFLRGTFGNRNEEGNLYPFVYLLPDGNLFIFANNRSILFDYEKNTIIKEYPQMPGDVGRNYPLTGSSVILPIKLKNGNKQSPQTEVMICGGAGHGNTVKANRRHIYEEASRTCGRLKVTDPNPQWVMEEMPTPRVNNDMVLLPTGEVLIINGGTSGTAGYDNSINPVFSPVLYDPNEQPGRRFILLNPTTIPRMYLSTAVLLPDGRVMVAGGNPHSKYNFTTNKFPTEMRLEAFSPPYLNDMYSSLRLSIMNLTNDSMPYNQKFQFNISIQCATTSQDRSGWMTTIFKHMNPMVYKDHAMYKTMDAKAKGEDGAGMDAAISNNGHTTSCAENPDPKNMTVVIISPPFTTHSFGMNQRMLVLDKISLKRLAGQIFGVTVYGPPSAAVAPAGYYMMFAVNKGIPSPHAVWVKVQ